MKGKYLGTMEVTQDITDLKKIEGEKRLLDWEARLKTVLFVCVENSFRSQIAEAYFNRYAPEGWTAVSAGVKPADEVHPNAVRIMLEEGIDISHKKPRVMTREIQEKADLVIIVCGGGSMCPMVQARRVEVWDVPDPAQMSLEEARRLRDMIKAKVLDLIERLKMRGEA
jgi:protein-tyrosine-phosphatase